MFDYMLERMKEPSSWRGLTWIAAAAIARFGGEFSADQQVAVMAAGATIAGALGAFLPSGKVKAIEVKTE